MKLLAKRQYSLLIQRAKFSDPQLLIIMLDEGVVAVAVIQYLHGLYMADVYKRCGNNVTPIN